MNMKQVVAAGMLAAALGLGPAGAGIISVNVGGFDAVHDVTGTLGAAPAANWNNLTAVNNPSGTDLVDDSGAATTMDMATSGWFQDTFNAWGDNRMDMYANFIHHDGDPMDSATVTLTDIPYATYDVYIYYTAFYMGNGGEIQPWTESQNSLTLYGLRGPSSGGQLSGYVQYQTTSHATALADAALVSPPDGPGGNYLKFSGLTASSLILTSSDPNQTGWKQAGLAGLQVVEVPEPTTLGLLGLAGALIVRRRRMAA